MSTRLDYRADIDGLRAIAVLSVVFFHAGITVFSGGFVGVDVFFVISGFLITTIVVREVEAGDFSIVRFYERRIRRIYPALYATIAFVLLTAFLLYDPSNFKQTSQSAAAATLFVSNILFWSQAGYFDKPSTLKPLLHTWSLAVEEQFYIVFPWIVLLLLKFATKWYKAALGALTLLSFGLSIYFMGREPGSAFYFFHLRAWELLLGGLLAVNAFPTCRDSALRNVFSLTGLAMILVSVFTYTETTAFPGFTALLPTVGSALIIYSGMSGSSAIGAGLGLPPLVFIGKISYSLYLWHWPIIIFGKYYLIHEPGWMDVFIWVATSFIAASLSWKFIENPFRAQNFLQRPKIFIFAGTVMALTVALAGAIYINNGIPQRFDEKKYAAVPGVDKQWRKWKECDNSAAVSPDKLIVCDMRSKGVAPSFLLWGDSHALALATAVEASAQRNNFSGNLIGRAACPPLLGVELVGQYRCAEYNDMIIQYIKTHPELKTVILSARWALSADGKQYKTEDQENVVLIDLESSTHKGQNAVIFASGLERTVKQLTALHRKIMIVMPVPEVGYNVPYSYFIALRTGRDINALIAPTYDEYLSRNKDVISAMERLESNYTVMLIDPAKMMCDSIRCLVVFKNRPLYVDSNHLSTFGAGLISNLFDPIFDATSPSAVKP